jgi:hypothetical protein
MTLDIAYMGNLANLLIGAPVADQLFDAKDILEIINRMHKAEKDAARYRWLRELRDTSEGQPFICCRHGGAISHWIEIPADEAIDQQIKLLEEKKV